MWINDEVLARNFSYKEIRLAWCTKGLLPVVLKGNYAEVANTFAHMNSTKLECFVSRLVKLTSEFVYKPDKNGELKYLRPKWWPEEFPFEHPISVLRKKRQRPSMSWNAILRKIISECAQFYKGEPLDIPRCRNQLYYYIKTLEKDENYENERDRGAKRKNQSECRWSTSGPNGKKRKVLQNKEETTSNVATAPIGEVSILKAHAQDDVVGLGTQKKEDFMEYMQLKGHSSTIKKTITSSKQYNPRLYQVPHIPFSSEAGRLLLEKEPQHVPQEVHLRKIERVEWHLKHEHSTKPQNTPQHYEVTYDERKDCHHARNYEFPKRQFHQRHPTFHEVPFLLSICRKRVSVSLTNDNLRELRRKFLIKKELYVKLQKMDPTKHK